MMLHDDLEWKWAMLAPRYTSPMHRNIDCNRQPTSRDACVFATGYRPPPSDGQCKPNK